MTRTFRSFESKIYWFKTLSWTGSVTFRKRGLSHDLSTQSRSKFWLGLFRASTCLAASVVALLGAMKASSYMAAPLSWNLGGHPMYPLKDLAPEKVYLLRVSTLPECARTTGNGFFSSLAKMNSIFIMMHFLRQRIHYKYAKIVRKRYHLKYIQEEPLKLTCKRAQ